MDFILRLKDEEEKEIKNEEATNQPRLTDQELLQAAQPSVQPRPSVADWLVQRFVHQLREMPLLWWKKLTEKSRTDFGAVRWP